MLLGVINSILVKLKLGKKTYPGDLGIDVSIFSDIGTLWDTDYPTNVKGKWFSPRASAGVAI